ncbi:exo-alpha-sialidase [Occultella aeris]|uniref:exo-alpha-sialidase n=1 Tax=Occultella aeris TaxID=2761496 RepID=A0A7M4DF95_9MICO|nr:sialidase family protein [Occultella aeris]VZO35588.1 Sialidase precursor [Occultella aeris]
MPAPITVFERDTHGYQCFRIPALVRTPAGTLLAFAEGRMPAVHTDAWCHDAAPIDLVLRRSTDDGATWGPLQVLLRGAGQDDSGLTGPDGQATRGNPAPVVVTRGPHAGRVALLSCHNPAGVRERTPFAQVSDDDGRTFSPARNLSHLMPDGVGWFATGPQHGLELGEGPRAGRLVVGINYDVDGARYGGLLCSDDAGQSWFRGGTVTGADPADIPQELGLVETAGGRLHAFARQNSYASLTRQHAVSTDGGDSFEAPFVGVPDLITTPRIQGSVVRVAPAGAPAPPGTTVLFSSPSDPDTRRTMTVWRSDDDAATWSEVGPLSDDRAGYSDLAVLAPGVVGILYETGAYPDGDSRDTIRFATLETP